MTATVCESAMREGDAGRSAAAQVSIVSRERRKVYAGVLAVLACVAVIAVVGTGEGAQGGTELLGVSAAAHSRSVLQQLLADVERVTSDVGGEFSLKAEQPVELEEAKKPCNAACKQRKQEIAARMKALRDQINHDFKAMTSTFSPTNHLSLACLGRSASTNPQPRYLPPCPPATHSAALLSFFCLYTPAQRFAGLFERFSSSCSL
jgi:hypothetical protein